MVNQHINDFVPNSVLNSNYISHFDIYVKIRFPVKLNFNRITLQRRKRLQKHKYETPICYIYYCRRRKKLSKEKKNEKSRF